MLFKINIIFISAIFFSFPFPLQADPFCGMTCKDILQMEKPTMVSLSADGTKILFVIETSSLEKNNVQQTLYLWKKSSSQQLLQWEKIEQILRGKENTWYILGKDEEEYKIISLEKDKLALLLSSKNPIPLFTVTQNGSDLYYTQILSTSQETLKNQQEEGYVYRWGSDSSSVTTGKSYAHQEWEEVRRVDLSSHQDTLVTRFSHQGWTDLYPLISDLQVSKEGGYLSLIIESFGDTNQGQTPFRSSLLVYDLQNQTSCRLFEKDSANQETPCWISEEEIIFQTNDSLTRVATLWKWNIQDHLYEKITPFYPEDKEVRALKWNEEQDLLFAESGDCLFYKSFKTAQSGKIDIPPSLIRPDYFTSILSWDLQARFFVGIDEALMQPPNVMLYDREEKTIQKLSSLNKHLEKTSLGTIEEILISPREGLSSKGFLIHPVREEAGKRYGLIIATYGFDNHTFVAEGQWHSSFPAQPLAAEGYFVLLLNANGSAQNLVGNPEKARQIEGWNVLETFEYAVDLLDQKGLIDPTKVGLYGWSHGAFIVEFLLAHSNKFQVACLGEGGDYSLAGFWLGGNTLWPKIYENMFGGPPWGSTLSNYLSYSPSFLVDQIKAPLLMEFVGGSVYPFELYTPLRVLHIPAELVFYEGEEHNFVKPKARLASMRRKIDWLNYWLFDKKPSEEEDYLRWEAMRSEYRSFQDPPKKNS